MSLRSDYDQWHRRSDEADPGHEDAASPWYTLVREYLGEIGGLCILEVACGRGGFAKELSRAGACVTGCDFSFAALRVAARRSRQRGQPFARLVQGDAQNLPFAANSFDMVISCETLEHLPDAHAGLREMYRVTRPGG